MTGQQAPRIRLQRILPLALFGLALLAGAFVALLAIADAGLLDRPIQRWASHRLRRTVTFKKLSMQLLSRHPRVDLEGLSISNPTWMRGGSVADVARLSATFRPSAMLIGSLEPSVIAVDGLSLHLVRVNPNRNNWTFGKPRNGQRAFGFLRSVRRLTVTAGGVDWIDLPRRLRFRASVLHEGGGEMPLRFEGQGELDGVPLGLAARGGPLYGISVDKPYPFVARMIDGATVVDAAGTSGDAFDLTRFRLAINAHGPNLADLGYLFNLRAPNSPPFRLATTAEGDGTRFTFNPLQVRLGGSDVRGWMRSNHTSQRHRATAELWSASWTKEDVRAVLAPIPPRTAARSRSGALPRDRRSRWILPDTAFPIENLRGIDLRARVHVRGVRGYPLPLDHLDAAIDLDNGKLTYSSVRAEIYGGKLAGSATLDVHRPTPVLTVAGAIDGLQLGRIPSRPGTRLSGELAITARLSGAGRSVHEAASNASGTMTVGIRQGAVPPAAAFMLGGDTLKAIRSMGDVRRPIGLDCLSARFSAARGRLVTHSLAIKTGAGDTLGRGMVNLGQESIRFTLFGRPTHPRPFQLAMPILIEGPVTHPKASVLPAPNATKLGLKGKLGVALSPLAALLPLGKQAPIRAACR